jgi:serine/threonine protein kinase
MHVQDWGTRTCMQTHTWPIPVNIVQNIDHYSLSEPLRRWRISPACIQGIVLTSFRIFFFFLLIWKNLDHKVSVFQLRFTVCFLVVCDRLSNEALSFIGGLLQLDPKKRLTAKDALEHEWIMVNSSPSK